METLTIANERAIPRPQDRRNGDLQLRERSGAGVSLPGAGVGPAALSGRTGSKG